MDLLSEKGSYRIETIYWKYALCLNNNTYNRLLSSRVISGFRQEDIVNIFIRFIGFQRQLTQIDRIRVPLSKKIEKVADLFGFLKTAYPQLVLQKEAVLVTVNNRTTSLDHRLNANDEVSFIPHVGGG